MIEKKPTEKTDDLEDLVKLSFFTEMGKAITSAKSLNEVMVQVMEKIGTIFAPLNWTLLLRNRKTGILRFKLVIGENADKLKNKTLPKGEGIAGWIAEAGQAVIIEDVSKDKRFSDSTDKFTGFKTESIIGVPLKSGGKVFGVIELINKINGEHFTPFELQVLSTIADFAAIAIEKAYYFRALKKLASVDSLTGVLNRRSLEKTLELEIERCKRYGTPLSLLWIDIDKFKEINDKYGHLAGDRVLKLTSEILVQNVRASDSVYRYGGDEFIVVLPSTNRDNAEHSRRRILDELEKHNAESDDLSFSFSIGLYSAEPDDVSEILSKTDLELYKEKSQNAEAGFENLDEHLYEAYEEDNGTTE